NQSGYVSSSAFSFLRSFPISSPAEYLRFPGPLMDYDFRNRSNSPYDPQIPNYRSSTSSPNAHPMYGAPAYPRVGGHQPGYGAAGAPPVGRHSSYHHNSAPPPPPSSSSSSGLGIRVALKPEYRISPPPQLLPMREVPRSNFQFDFEFERKLLAEAEKGEINWSRLGLDNLPQKATGSTSSSGSGGDPVVSKYIAAGLDREAVPVAVANYGDNPTKVREFAKGYTLLREMGFSSNNVAEALLMNNNDTDKALAHFLNSPT
ncbi:hypothetical protein LINGRAHAP2_LOCUS17176, partial [Linum grandiflorum]